MIKKALLTLALLMAPMTASAVQHDENAMSQIKSADDASETMQTDTTERWVDQTRMHDAEAGIAGNCAQAAVASLMGVKLEAVPDFTEGQIADTPDTPDTLARYWKRFESYFAEQGLVAVRLDGNYCFEGYHLASGPSPRGPSHMIVRKSGTVVHDPHPSRDGLLEVQHVYIVASADPSRWVEVPLEEYVTIAMAPEELRHLARMLQDQADRDEVGIS